jgi:hypothetical protein
MSLIDMSQFDSIGIDAEAGPGTLALRRRWACDAVLAELGAAATPTDKPAVALRDYGEGCVAVGLAGVVDRARALRIGVLLRELRPRSTRELVVTFERLGRWHPHLVRVIGQARIHHLIDGGRFELRGTTPDLAEALGLAPRAAKALSRQDPDPEDRELRCAPWGLQR